ncbi:hypothetical protein [Streptomyces sp. LMG1-1-1.1]|uniref:hypothetical protein n=1 Tax=Streptomyces sp. LMG1-1-1.1 TaxID=3135245 RepID=UPI00346504C0
MRTRARRLTAALAVTGALLALPACASSVDPIERLGRKAAERVSPHPSPAREARGTAEDAKGCGEWAGDAARVRAGDVAEDRAGDAAKDPAAVRVAARTEPLPVTPRSDELALRLTEC